MKHFLIVMALFISTSSAYAQAKGYAGLGIGLSVPDAEDTSARAMYSIMGGARLDGEFGIGGFYISSSKEESRSNLDVDFNYNLYGIEGSFHFEGVADGAFFGARVGLAKVKVADQNYSPMVWGIHLGYDHFLTEAFSLGCEAGFLSVSGEAKSNATDLDGFTMVNFMAVTKMWF